MSSACSHPARADPGLWNRPPLLPYRADVAEDLVPVFRVEDGHVAAAWYERLGFVVVAEHRFEPDLPLYLFLRRGDLQLHLSEHTGDAPPGSVAYLYTDDVDGIAAEFDEVVRAQPWGREVELRDPFGNRLRIGTIMTTG